MKTKHNTESKTKNKNKKRKVILKRSLIGCMIAAAAFPMFEGFFPKSKATKENEKIVQAYNDSLTDPQLETDIFAPDIEGTFEVVEILSDTSLTVIRKDQEQQVRMIGVEQEQDTAGENLKKLLSDDYVDLELDVIENNKDGELLAYVYLKDGRFLNEELLMNGYAKVSDETENVKYLDLLKNAEKSAKERKVGIWAEE